MSRTDRQRLADHLLGRPVEAWVQERRTAGISWRLIARELLETTQGQIDVTTWTLQRWLEEPAEAEAAPSDSGVPTPSTRAS